MEYSERKVEWRVTACWASSRMQKRGVWAVSEVDNACAAAAPGGVVGFGGGGRRTEGGDAC